MLHDALELGVSQGVLRRVGEPPSVSYAKVARHVNAEGQRCDIIAPGDGGGQPGGPAPPPAPPPEAEAEAAAAASPRVLRTSGGIGSSAAGRAGVDSGGGAAGPGSTSASGDAAGVSQLREATALVAQLNADVAAHCRRVREWYGWHFPELSILVPDRLSYVRVVALLGNRSNAAKADLSTVLPDDVAKAVVAAAESSMGTDLSAADMTHIADVVSKVVDMDEYRQRLEAYMASRMAEVAPNLARLVASAAPRSSAGAIGDAATADARVACAAPAAAHTRDVAPAPGDHLAAVQGAAAGAIEQLTADLGRCDVNVRRHAEAAEGGSHGPEETYSRCHGGRYTVSGCLLLALDDHCQCTSLWHASHAGGASS